MTDTKFKIYRTIIISITGLILFTLIYKLIDGEHLYIVYDLDFSKLADIGSFIGGTFGVLITLLTVLYLSRNYYHLKDEFDHKKNIDKDNYNHLREEFIERKKNDDIKTYSELFFKLVDTTEQSIKNEYFHSDIKGKLYNYNEIVSYFFKFLFHFLECNLNNVPVTKKDNEEFKLVCGRLNNLFSNFTICIGSLKSMTSSIKDIDTKFSKILAHYLINKFGNDYNTLLSLYIYINKTKIYEHHNKNDYNLTCDFLLEYFPFLVNIDHENYIRKNSAVGTF